MPFAPLRDITLFYEERGAGEPLLLLAGQGLDHHSWDFCLDDFAPRYRLITYDYRGTGQSDKPTEPPYSTRGLAQDVVGLLDHLRIARAHAYGISMGGRVSQWLGIDYPDRVGCLVLGSATPGYAHGKRPPAEYMAAFLNPPTDPKERAAVLVSTLVSAGWFANHPERIAKVTATTGAPLSEQIRKLHYLASEQHDSWEFLPRIKAHTLILHGSDDPLIPVENARLLADRIPGAELHIVQGARHGYHIEFQKDSNQVVLDFLARHPISGA